MENSRFQEKNRRSRSLLPRYRWRTVVKCDSGEDRGNEPTGADYRAEGMIPTASQ